MVALVVIAETDVKEDQSDFRLGLLPVSVPIQDYPKRIHPGYRSIIKRVFTLECLWWNGHPGGNNFRGILNCKALYDEGCLCHDAALTRRCVWTI